MTLTELNKWLGVELQKCPGCDSREAAATARLLLEDSLGVNQTTLLTHGERVMEPETVERFRRMTERIIDGEPPQYVTGHAHFMGMDLKVTPDTLIPRPETAELVDLVVDDFEGRRDLRILDAGTGSGCIAIALSRTLPFAEVIAIDISTAALAVAKDNAERLGAKIRFEKKDIMDLNDMRERFDIIVSNPPYIAESERDAMELRVKGHEPEQALFVPDSDPLKFYRALAEYASSLNPRPRLFFEINPLFSEEMKEMLSSKGYDCDIRLDSFGKKRFALAVPNR